MFSKLDSIAVVTMLAFLIIVGLWLGPALFIWAINAIFETSLVLTFKTWFAIIVLRCLIAPVSIKKD